MFIGEDLSASYELPQTNNLFAHISRANGKDFLYMQQHFKKMYQRTKSGVCPLLWGNIFHKNQDIIYKTLESLDTFSYQVRVLLEEVSNASSRILSSEKGIKITYGNGNKKAYPIHASRVEIMYKHGSWYLNRKKVAREQLMIQPLQGHLSFNDNNYAGSFLLIADKGKGYIISQLDIEDYIYSVLRSESWPGWPVEVNKAFAIASRSYLVAKILEAAKKKQPFHIKNTNIHQTYNGVHEFLNLRRAVDETKGIILAHEQQPIIAMFDACCGGVIPAHIENAIDFKKAPYLARDYQCTFCKDFRIYSWKIEYSPHEVLKLLNESGIPVSKLHDIRVTKDDKAGVVQEVMVHDGKTGYLLNGKQCYSLFGNVKSFCFSISKMKQKIVLAGRGYGHHLGICQWGARGMIDHGWDFKRILQFYYPGTDFVRLKTS